MKQLNCARGRQAPETGSNGQYRRFEADCFDLIACFDGPAANQPASQSTNEQTVAGNKINYKIYFILTTSVYFYRGVIFSPLTPRSLHSVEFQSRIEISQIINSTLIYLKIRNTEKKIPITYFQ